MLVPGQVFSKAILSFMRSLDTPRSTATSRRSDTASTRRRRWKWWLSELPVESCAAAGDRDRVCRQSRRPLGVSPAARLRRPRIRSRAVSGGSESPEPPLRGIPRSMDHQCTGKTSLLEVCAELASDAGAKVILLTGMIFVSSPPAVLEALGVLEAPEAESHLASLSHEGRLVIMFDTYERLGQLDEWVRTWLVPRLPATALTVLAGRAAPDSAWRADPAWRAAACGVAAAT